MTDITDEQRAALRTLNGKVWNGDQLAAWNELRKLLPSELTNLQPALPTDHGEYHDEAGNLWWLNSGGWYTQSGHWLESSARECGPFTRLVPERPQITREHVIAVFDSYGDNCDLETINDLVDLANGTYRD